MPSLKNTIAEYFHQTFGLDVAPTPWRKASQLAPFLNDRYRFLRGSLLGHDLLLMMDESDEEESPASIRKHIAQVRPKCDWPIVYVRERVTSYNRKRLIEQRVPFVVPGTQMYLPELGIDFREHFRSKAGRRPRFRPATQAVFIHFLLRVDSGPMSTAVLAPELGLSAMTLSRAFDEIESAGLGESRTSGRERLVHFSASRRELWARAETLLVDPVKSRHFVHAPHGESLGLHAGLSALARYTMISEPRNPVIAMSRERWTSLRRRGIVGVLPLQEELGWEVEVWSYTPMTHRMPNVVDPLSLYLSLRRSPDRDGDERVAQALEQLMESVQW